MKRINYEILPLEELETVRDLLIHELARVGTAMKRSTTKERPVTGKTECPSCEKEIVVMPAGVTVGTVLRCPNCSEYCMVQGVSSQPVYAVERVIVTTK